MIEGRVHRGPLELDVYRVALQLIDAVPKSSQHPGAVGFWYTNEPLDGPIRSVQSTYLWGFSRLQGAGRGLPFLEPADVDRLRRMELRWLVLLAEQGAELERARQALQRLGVTYQVVSRRALAAGSFALRFELLELRPNP
jgi:hypothetical protein